MIDFFPDMELPLLLSVADVAEVLNISVTSGYQIVNSGALPNIRIGKIVRIPKQAFLDYLIASYHERT